MSEKISIILCTFNEINYIENTIKKLINSIPNLELVIVDDNSTDGTIEKIKSISSNNKIKLIVRKKAKGLASAFQRGIYECTGEFIGWVDSNMEEIIPRFTEMKKLLYEDNDIIVLSRYVEGGGDERIALRSISSKVFNKFCSTVLRIPFKDYTSGLFLMKRSVLNNASFIPYGHGEFFIEFIYNAIKRGSKVLEIPFVQKKDNEISQSKSSPNTLYFFYLGVIYVFRVFITILRRD
tara:strand:- start:16 stop:726 length:711 start_codon:yes stop_codon:yes gene_type:complete